MHIFKAKCTSFRDKEGSGQMHLDTPIWVLKWRLEQERGRQKHEVRFVIHEGAEQVLGQRLVSEQDQSEREDEDCGFRHKE